MINSIFIYERKIIKTELKMKTMTWLGEKIQWTVENNLEQLLINIIITQLNRICESYCQHQFHIHIVECAGMHYKLFVCGNSNLNFTVNQKWKAICIRFQCVCCVCVWCACIWAHLIVCYFLYESKNLFSVIERSAKYLTSTHLCRLKSFRV